jgi:environmental stress-induced protein Ves
MNPGLRIVRRSAFTGAPWKNGGGITYEAMREPADGGPFRWRLSVAHIEASGPFSDFAGYNRKMVLLRGAGMSLSFADGRKALLRTVGDLTEFDGALPAHCELLGSPCVDLNLMVSKSIGAVSARVARLPEAPGLSLAGDDSTIVFAVSGRLDLRGDDGRCASLEPWDLAVVSPPAERFTLFAPPDSSEAPLVFLAGLNDTQTPN